MTMARSKSIWGPYEVDPENPMATSDQDNSELLQKCGHGDLVETPDGEWYLVHLCARPPKGKKRCLLGRETGIQKVYWNEEGWLRLTSGGRIAQNETEGPSGGEAALLPTAPESGKDDFDSPELGVRYSIPRVPLGDKISFTERPGWLRLYGQESLNSLHQCKPGGSQTDRIPCICTDLQEFDPACRNSWQAWLTCMMRLISICSEKSGRMTADRC